MHPDGRDPLVYSGCQGKCHRLGALLNKNILIRALQAENTKFKKLKDLVSERKHIQVPIWWLLFMFSWGSGHFNTSFGRALIPLMRAFPAGPYTTPKDASFTIITSRNRSSK